MNYKDIGSLATIVMVGIVLLFLCACEWDFELNIDSELLIDALT